ncbi:sigma 54-interacting transcriptional regulator [Nevskia sp.]|nr:sigma 54-interacting transcriptional regulator [Nevskia sp.]
MLIEGETGTEKEALARATHQRNLRRGKPFVAVHSAANQWFRIDVG